MSPLTDRSRPLDSGVMQGRVHPLRIDLTAEGLPRGGVGFELFDQGGLAMSQFLQNVDIGARWKVSKRAPSRVLMRCAARAFT